MHNTQLNPGFDSITQGCFSVLQCEEHLFPCLSNCKETFSTPIIMDFLSDGNYSLHYNKVESRGNEEVSTLQLTYLAEVGLEEGTLFPETKVCLISSSVIQSI